MTHPTDVDATVPLTCHKCGTTCMQFVPTMFWRAARCTVCRSITYITRKGDKIKTQIAKPKRGHIIQ